MFARKLIFGKYVLIAIFVLIPGSYLIGMNELESFTKTCSSELALFLTKHAPPPEICESIEKNKKEIILFEKEDEVNKEKKTKTKKLEGIPGFYVKKDVSRIFNALRLKKLINNAGLVLVDVAQKYVYPVDGILYVFAEEIKESSQTSLYTINEIKALSIIARESGFGDFGERNIKRDINKKLIFIDTENLSFKVQYNPIRCICDKSIFYYDETVEDGYKKCDGGEYFNVKNFDSSISIPYGSIPFRGPLNALQSLLVVYRDCMTKDALEYLKNFIYKFIKKRSGYFTHPFKWMGITITDKCEYDELDFDFKKLKTEIKKLKTKKQQQKIENILI